MLKRICTNNRTYFTDFIQKVKSSAYLTLLVLSYLMYYMYIKTNNNRGYGKLWITALQNSVWALGAGILERK